MKSFLIFSFYVCLPTASAYGTPNSRLLDDRLDQHVVGVAILGNRWCSIWRFRPSEKWFQNHEPEDQLTLVWKCSAAPSFDLG